MLFAGGVADDETQLEIPFQPREPEGDPMHVPRQRLRQLPETVADQPVHQHIVDRNPRRAAPVAAPVVQFLTVIRLIGGP